MRYYIPILILLVIACGNGKMTTLHNINHNAGGAVTNFWDSETDPGGGISVTGAAGLNSTANGLQFDMSVTDEMKVDSVYTPPASNEIRFRVYFDPNGTTQLGDIEIATVGIWVDANHGKKLVEVRLLNNAADTNISVDVSYGDAGGFSIFPEVVISDMPHCTEISIVRETGGDSNGVVKWWLDGVLQNQDNAVENNADWVAYDEIFAIGNDEAVVGSTNLYIDEIFVTDVASVSIGCSPETFTLGTMTKPASIDADGLFLYIAAINSSNFPTVIKISSALSVDGTLVFDPDDGSNIGVQCGRFDADVVWIAGEFGIVEGRIQRSADAGTTFTDVGSGSFADILNFTVGPDSDSRVLIYDDNNPDILETIDNGTVWTTIATGMSTFVNAMARLATNVQEAVFGNGADPPNPIIEYSVNSGVDREDIDTGFPESDVTGVIVN